MAVLPDQDRADVDAAIQTEVSAARDPIAVTKADLRAAVNAADDWVDSNAAAYNAALPLPARTALTASQKAQLLTRIVEKRWIKGV